MRVSMPTIFHGIQSHLASLAEELQRINASLASGRKYQSITDNPVEVGAMLGLGTESGQVVQYQRNLATAQDWLRVTETTLQNINDLVRRAMTLANQMATGTYTAAQRAAAAKEVQGLLEEVMQVGNTRYNGQYILSGYRVHTAPFAPGDFEITGPVLHLLPGSTGSVTPGGTYTGTAPVSYVVEIVHGGPVGVATYRVSTDGGQTWSGEAVTGAGVPVGSDGVTADFFGTWQAKDRFSISVQQPIEYQGDEHPLELGIGRQSRLQVNQVGKSVVGGDGGPLDVFRILGRLQNGLQANDLTEIGASLEELRTYQNHLHGRLAALGAGLNRVEVKNRVYDSVLSRLQSALSAKGDTEVVSAVNSLKAAETAYQAALLSATKVMSLSLLEYM